jgi:hypothetical protein
MVEKDGEEGYVPVGERFRKFETQQSVDFM